MLLNPLQFQEVSKEPSSRERASHSSTAREVYPSLASLIAEILTSRTPQSSPEPGPLSGGENGTVTQENPFASVDKTQPEKSGADFTASETAEPSTIRVPVAPVDPALSDAEGDIPLMGQAFEDHGNSSPQAGSNVGTDRAGAGPPVSPTPAFEQAVGDEPDDRTPSNRRRASETPPTVQQSEIERPNLQKSSPAVQTPVPETPRPQTAQSPAVQTPELPKVSPRRPVKNGPLSAPAPAASQTPSAVRSEPFLPDGERILNSPERGMDTPPSPGVQTPSAEDAGGQQAQPDTTTLAASRPAPVTASKPAGIQQTAVPPAAETLQETYRVSEQLVRGVRFLSRGGTSQVTLRLDPPELGQVTIRLVSSDQTISGEIAVQNRLVHEVVQTHLNDLRQALADQGIQVDQLGVSVDNRGTSGADRDPSQPSSQDPSGRPDPDNEPDQQRRSSPRNARSEGESTPDEGHVDFTA